MRASTSNTTGPRSGSRLRRFLGFGDEKAPQSSAIPMPLVIQKAMASWFTEQNEGEGIPLQQQGAQVECRAERLLVPRPVQLAHRFELLAEQRRRLVELPSLLQEVAEAARPLGYVVVDVGLTADGRWAVVEANPPFALTSYE